MLLCRAPCRNCHFNDILKHRKEYYTLEFSDKIDLLLRELNKFNSPLDPPGPMKYAFEQVGRMNLEDIV